MRTKGVKFFIAGLVSVVAVGVSPVATSEVVTWEFEVNRGWGLGTGPIPMMLHKGMVTLRITFDTDAVDLDRRRNNGRYVFENGAATFEVEQGGHTFVHDKKIIISVDGGGSGRGISFDAGTRSSGDEGGPISYFDSNYDGAIDGHIIFSRQNLTMGTPRIYGDALPANPPDPLGTSYSGGYTYRLDGQNYPITNLSDWDYNRGPGGIVSVKRIFPNQGGLSPVTDAGADQVATAVGGTVQLDGTASFDPEGEVLTYQWSVIDAPYGVTVTLDAPTSPTPSFVIEGNTPGDYVFELTTSDGHNTSTSTVTVSFENLPPIADARHSQTAIVGDYICIDGSGSHDPNGDLLTYYWTLPLIPSASTAVVSDPYGMEGCVTVDVDGQFDMSLVVNDGLLDSEPAQVTLTVITLAEASTLKVMQIEKIIALMSSDGFKNVNNGQDNFLQKLGKVSEKIAQGNYISAKNKLDTIMGGTNGCDISMKPDNDDKVILCGDSGLDLTDGSFDISSVTQFYMDNPGIIPKDIGQYQIYPPLQMLKSYLERLSL